ncbi:MAG: PepSY-like domain-containing protein [Prevotellaceae bacterium]|nr:PepSY-like domain-containing protein [Prevotellaceae bacterium]
MKHLANAFPNISIREVNRERYGYEIGLFNHMDLKFDSNGKEAV